MSWYWQRMREGRPYDRSAVRFRRDIQRIFTLVWWLIGLTLILMSVAALLIAALLLTGLFVALLPIHWFRSGTIAG